MSDPIGGKIYTQYRQDIINQYSQKGGAKHLRFDDGKQLYVHSTWKPSRWGKQAALDRLEKRKKAAEELKQSINREFQQLAPDVGDKVFHSLKAQGHDFSAHGIKLNEQWRIDQAIAKVLKDEAKEIIDPSEASFPNNNELIIKEIGTQEVRKAKDLETVANMFEAVANPSPDPKQDWARNKGTTQDRVQLRQWPGLIAQANCFKAAIDADYGQSIGDQIEEHLEKQRIRDVRLFHGEVKRHGDRR